MPPKQSIDDGFVQLEEKFHLSSWSSRFDSLESAVNGLHIQVSKLTTQPHFDDDSSFCPPHNYLIQSSSPYWPPRWLSSSPKRLPTSAAPSPPRKTLFPSAATTRSSSSPAAAVTTSSTTIHTTTTISASTTAAVPTTEFPGIPGLPSVIPRLPSSRPPVLPSRENSYHYTFTTPLTATVFSSSFTVTASSPTLASSSITSIAAHKRDPTPLIKLSSPEERKTNLTHCATIIPTPRRRRRVPPLRRRLLPLHRRKLRHPRRQLFPSLPCRNFPQIPHFHRPRQALRLQPPPSAPPLAHQYIKLVKKHGLEISQPVLDPSRGLTWQITEWRGDREVHKDTEVKSGWCSDPHLPPCAAFVEIMATVFSRDAWRCIWQLDSASAATTTPEVYDWDLSK